MPSAWSALGSDPCPKVRDVCTTYRRLCTGNNLNPSRRGKIEAKRGRTRCDWRQSGSLQSGDEDLWQGRGVSKNRSWYLRTILGQTATADTMISDGKLQDDSRKHHSTTNNTRPQCRAQHLDLQGMSEVRLCRPSQATGRCIQENRHTNTQLCSDLDPPKSRLEETFIQGFASGGGRRRRISLSRE